MARRRRSGERHHPQRHVARARVLVAVRAGGVRVFFFNDTATTEIYTGWYTLPLHDALPISETATGSSASTIAPIACARSCAHDLARSEEHTSELQSHHPISYAVFCLKK